MKQDVFSIAVIFSVVIIYFFRFFWPEPQIIVTPGDAWSSSYTQMALLSKILKSGALPLWTTLRGNGFPLDGDALGTYYPLTFFLFRFFETTLAYNLLIVLSLIAFGIGMYVWLRRLGIAPIPSLLSAGALPVSGITIPRLEHIVIIHSLSLLPWVMVGTHELVRSKSKKAILLLGVLAGLQILGAYPQVSFITLFLSLLYYGFSVWKRNNRIARALAYIAAIILALGIGAVQLLPSFALLQHSVYRNGFAPTNASYYSFPAGNLMTFFWPYANGDPKTGTYQKQNPPGSLFWENSGFVGWAPLVMFAVASVLLIKKQYDKDAGTTVHSMITIGVISFFLMLGSHSPFYLVYAVFPFSQFRTPSRFLWVFVFALLTVAAYGANALWRKKYAKPFLRAIITLAALASIAHVSWSWWSYHLLDHAKVWNLPPKTLQFLKPESRVYARVEDQYHYTSYSALSIPEGTPYEFYRNLLPLNSNVLWNIGSTATYATAPLRRTKIVENLLNESMKQSNHADHVSIDDMSQKLLTLNAVGTVLSTLPISGEHALKLNTTLSSGDGRIYVYDNQTALPRAYMADDTRIAKTVLQAEQILADTSFMPGRSVIAEEPLEIKAEGILHADTQITDQSDTRVSVSVSRLNKQAVLVLADTYYPAWKATLDGKPVRIYPVNINQRGVIVPSGNHSVTFFYESTLFKIGSIITATAFVFTAFIIIIVLAKNCHTSSFGTRAP